MSSAWVNTRLIAERRVALNMSERALVQATGITHRLIYTADGATGALVGHVTLAELSRLAATLGVTPAELLTPDDAAPDGPPPDDVAVLVAALMDEAKVKFTSKDDLALALGWPLERVDEAARQAAEHLPALGLTLHLNRHVGLGVLARHGALTSQEQQKLARAKTVRGNLRLHHARVLHDVGKDRFGEDWQRALSANHRAVIPALLKRGLIEATPAGLRLTATAAYSLMLTEDPAPDEEGSRSPRYRVVYGRPAKELGDEREIARVRSNDRSGTEH